SVKEHSRVTSDACHRTSGDSHPWVWGASLSTLLPPMGPAVTQLLTASHTWWEPVEASLVSVPAATKVDRLKTASAGSARSDPPSEAVQAMETSVACQAPSAEPQLTLGALRSTLMPVKEPAVAQLFTLSHTW